MKTTQPLAKVTKSGQKTPSSQKSRLLPALVKPPADVLRVINPDPGHKLIEATEALAAEVIPAIKADYHLAQMFRRLRNLIDEGEGWSAIDEHKRINDHIALICTHYFERKKVRRCAVRAASHIGPGRIVIVLSVLHPHNRHQATKLLEIQTQ